jgi:hypothetical protein
MSDNIVRLKRKPDPQVQICSICKRGYTGLGNNAWPVNEARCCNDCNWTVVIPARFRLYFRTRKGGNDAQV